MSSSKQNGTLLTILPISGYVPTHPEMAPPPADQVTTTRMEEDARFAAACSMSARFLNLSDAPYLGHASRDLRWVEQNVQRIEPALMKVLSNCAARCRPGERPWLFCPSGIGGHVDHVAVRMVVTRHLERLAGPFRLAFYEDLHYASDPVVRWDGIAELLRALPGRSFRRQAWPLGDAVGTKLALIRLYASQFLELPGSIRRFTPASEATAQPHEAILDRGAERAGVTAAGRDGPSHRGYSSFTW